MSQSDILRSSIQRMQAEIRGGVDGWDFTQLVLTTLFFRYASERLDSEWGHPLRFDGMLEHLDDENLGEELNESFRRIVTDIYDISLDVDCASTRLGESVDGRNRNLRIVLQGVANLALEVSASIDIFGDAYEFLISNYAAHAGKSGGEFFTPQCVSRLVAHIAERALPYTFDSIYDPTCGSGSLLIRARESQPDCEVFGQEINLTTYNLARMNMVLHGVPTNKFHIVRGDTLAHDGHEGEQFDVIVSNPPYSTHWAGSDNPEFIKDERFAPAGVLAPKSKADMAFVMHALYHLSERGRAAIVCFPGILYRSGAEQKIRQYLVDNNYVETVISLAPNLFFGTTIAVNIMVLSRCKPDNKTQFIDASGLFKKETNNNILLDEHIEEIMRVFGSKEDVEHFAKSVDSRKIAENDYNLSVSSYVEAKDTREVVDIVKLNADLKTTVAKIDQLRAEIDAIVTELEA